jgi:Ca2+-binding RTX toxin-like protein
MTTSFEGASADEDFTGGAGNDLFIASGGADIYRGDSGTDTVDYSASALQRHEDLHGRQLRHRRRCRGRQACSA